MIELEKYDNYGMKFSNYNNYNEVFYENSKNMDWEYYYYKKEPGNLFLPNAYQYKNFERHDFAIGNYTTETLAYFTFVYKKPYYGGSQELDDYVKNSSLHSRLTEFFAKYREDYYALDKKYYDDLIEERREITDKNRELEDNLYLNKRKLMQK